jgi:thiol-disulfide isomerase/thioredoxin
MRGVKIGLVLLGVFVVAAVIAQSLGVGRKPPPAVAPPPRPPVAAPRDPAAAAEQRLLSEGTFSHTVNGVAAPDVPVAGPDGREVRLSSLRGKVLFVNFWATWCQPCLDEMPSMLKLGKELAASHPNRFQMVAVSNDETWDAVHQYFQKTFGGAPGFLRLTRDPGGAAAKAYYCAARGYCPDVKFPETFIVDRNGRIVEMVVGPRDWSEPKARRWLDGLIGG